MTERGGPATFAGVRYQVLVAVPLAFEAIEEYLASQGKGTQPSMTLTLEGRALEAERARDGWDIIFAKSEREKVYYEVTTKANRDHIIGFVGRVVYQLDGGCFCYIVAESNKNSIALTKLASCTRELSDKTPMECLEAILPHPTQGVNRIWEDLKKTLGSSAQEIARALSLSYVRIQDPWSLRNSSEWIAKTLLSDKAKAKELVALLRDYMGESAEKRQPFAGKDLVAHLEKADFHLSLPTYLKDDTSRLYSISEQAELLPNKVGDEYRKPLPVEFLELARFGRLNAIIGEAGVGKSAYVRDLFEKARALSDITPVYIPAGTYSGQQRDEIKEQLRLRHDLLEVLADLSRKEALIILVDGLDECRRIPGAAKIWATLIREMAALPNAKVVITCRDFDWTAEPEFESIRKLAESQLLSRWEANEVYEALRAEKVASPHSNLLELLTNPFFLDLYIRLYRLLGNHARTIETEIGLLEKYWETNVMLAEAKPGEYGKALKWLGERPEKNAFSYDHFSSANPIISEEWHRRSILVREGPICRFRHEMLSNYALLDYKEWLIEPQLLMQFLECEPLQPIWRPVVTLGFKVWLAREKWEIIGQVLDAALRKVKGGWIYPLLNQLTEQDFSQEFLRTFKRSLWRVRISSARINLLTHFIRYLQMNNNFSWIAGLRKLPVRWWKKKNHAELADLYANAADYLKAAIDSKNAELEADILRTGLFMEKQAAFIDFEWAQMKLLRTLSTTESPELIPILIERAGSKHTRVRWPCREQAVWVSKLDPEQGAKLVRRALGFEGEAPEKDRDNFLLDDLLHHFWQEILPKCLKAFPEQFLPIVIQCLERFREKEKKKRAKSRLSKLEKNSEAKSQPVLKDWAWPVEDYSHISYWSGRSHLDKVGEITSVIEVALNNWADQEEHEKIEIGIKELTQQKFAIYPTLLLEALSRNPQIFREELQELLLKKGLYICDSCHYHLREALKSVLELPQRNEKWESQVLEIINSIPEIASQLDIREEGAQIYRLQYLSDWPSEILPEKYKKELETARKEGKPLENRPLCRFERMKWEPEKEKEPETPLEKIKTLHNKPHDYVLTEDEIRDANKSLPELLQEEEIVNDEPAILEVAAKIIRLGKASKDVIDLAVKRAHSLLETLKPEYEDLPRGESGLFARPHDMFQAAVVAWCAICKKSPTEERMSLLQRLLEYPDIAKARMLAWLEIEVPEGWAKWYLDRLKYLAGKEKHPQIIRWNVRRFIYVMLSKEYSNLGAELIESVLERSKDIEGSDIYIDLLFEDLAAVYIEASERMPEIAQGWVKDAALGKYGNVAQHSVLFGSKEAVKRNLEIFGEWKRFRDLYLSAIPHLSSEDRFSACLYSSHILQGTESVDIFDELYPIFLAYAKHPSSSMVFDLAGALKPFSHIRWTECLEILSNIITNKWEEIEHGDDRLAINRMGELVADMELQFYSRPNEEKEKFIDCITWLAGKGNPSAADILSRIGRA